MSNNRKLNHATAKPFVNRKDISVSKFWGSVIRRDSNFNPSEQGVVQPKGKFCQSPFTWLEINLEGRAYMCCPTWLPYAIGEIKTQSIAEVWNGRKAQLIRESILTGDFGYCNIPLCPKIQSNILQDRSQVPAENIWTVDPACFPKHINFSTDESCNLSCPSCRIGWILHADGPEYQQRQDLDDKIWNEILAQPLDLDLTVHITGSGDPFGSKIFRERLLGLDLTHRPNLRIVLRTNGVMLTPKIWQQLSRIHSNIDSISISFDAATEDTYNITRRGGHWQTLLDNMRHLDAACAGKIKLNYDYVTQFSNSAEMLDFCKLISQISPNYNGVQFTRVSNWGTWPLEVFEHEAIWMEKHPHHENWLHHISDPAFDQYRINWSNISQFRSRAISKYQR